MEANHKKFSALRSSRGATSSIIRVRSNSKSGGKATYRLKVTKSIHQVNLFPQSVKANRNIKSSTRNNSDLGIKHKVPPTSRQI
jgi:hypothetical protein